jgi:hypothetical protein
MADFNVCDGCGEELEVVEVDGLFFCAVCTVGEMIESPMTEGVDLFGPGAPFEIS